jgi:hypothetical protein
MLDEDDDADAEAAELAALKTTWRARYAAYARALTAAVLAEAARIPGLRVPVTVEANSDQDERRSLVAGLTCNGGGVPRIRSSRRAPLLERGSARMS